MITTMMIFTSPPSSSLIPRLVLMIVVLFLVGGGGGIVGRNNNNNNSMMFAYALYAEDAGVLDFTVATTGHGVTDYVFTTSINNNNRNDDDDDLVITTDIPTTTTTATTSKGTSCYVAGRKKSDGTLLWRRNVCSVTSSKRKERQQDHHHHWITATTTKADSFFTVDGNGIVRSWSVQDGSLLWDTNLPGGVGIGSGDDDSTVVAAQTIWTIQPSSSERTLDLVAVSSNEELTLLDAATGKVFDKVTALSALGNGGLKGGKHVQWLSVFFLDGSTNIQAVFGLVDDKGSIKGGSSDLYRVELEVGNDQFKAVQPLHVKGNIVANSFQVQHTSSSKYHGLAVLEGGGTMVDIALDGSSDHHQYPSSQLHPKWVSIVSIQPTHVPSIVQIMGKEGTKVGDETFMGLFRYGGRNNGWERLAASSGSGGEDAESSEFMAITYCPEAKVVVAIDTTSLKVYRYDSNGSTTTTSLSPPLTITGDMYISDGDTSTVFSLLQCTTDKVSTLLGTERGSTVTVSIAMSTEETTASVVATVDWTAEEGLSTLTSAIVLDGSHFGADDLVEEQDVVTTKLSLQGRLIAQWDNLMKVASLDGRMMTDVINFSSRDHIFGFVKVTAMLSPTSHRMWGMNTSGGANNKSHRGTIRWSLDLPKDSIWHKMVHGTTNSAKAVYGINGDTHSKEILVLSATPTTIDWMCIDGTNGAIYAQASVPISSDIVQILPFYGSTTSTGVGGGGCRQASLLLHDDLTLTTIPSDEETMKLALKYLTKTPNGLYTHKVDTVTNQLESYQVVTTTSSSSNLIARPVGRTSFPGERIVKVAYPIRHEKVQSMSTILGDNSLLLKYINPHMAVIVTMLFEEEQQSPTLLATALNQVTRKKQRKPVGAGETAVEQDEEILPNMFINLVDTVSGRVLHRTSHTNVDGTKDVSVVITENWVVYSYINSVTRRTEVGVLTLHEGMIDSRGMTLFTTPDQTTSFSSFDARESKPVVLAKTYAFPKAITALGVTSTRQGISSQNILLASSDGALHALHRVILETRRPLGDAKVEEKKEGLVPYRELIPESPLTSLTYNRTVEPFTYIVSAETSLESQSLVFGFGGPDLFFTRTSPTKGFDLLPESFNKILVGITTVGIVIVLLILQRMGRKKTFSHGWL